MFTRKKKFFFASKQRKTHTSVADRNRNWDIEKWGKNRETTFADAGEEETIEAYELRHEREGEKFHGLHVEVFRRTGGK